MDKFGLLLFFPGIYLLIRGAKSLVDGSSNLARRWGVSDLVVGMTVVAFGTSAPELFVSLHAAFSKTPDIAIGNLIGSNISNILLILGICGMIFPLKVSKQTVWREIPFSLAGALLMLFLLNDEWTSGAGANVLSRADGSFLLVIFLLALYHVLKNAKRERLQHKDIPKAKTWKLWLEVVLGIAALSVGGRWVVAGSLSFAQMVGLSEAFVGLTIVAVGTSLPELAASAVAAWKKNPDIAVGNIVGSNIFNIFLILGLSGILRPMTYNTFLNLDIFWLIAASLLLFFLLFVGRRHTVERWQGAVMFGCYCLYIASVALRG